MPLAMHWPALPAVYALRPLCRGGMGEALWIRRGTLARMACGTQMRYLNSARERLYRGSDLRTLRHFVFLVFYNYLCAECAQASKTA